MKHLLVLMMVAAFAIGFVGCGDDDDDGAACTEDDVTACGDTYETCGTDCAEAEDPIQCAFDCLSDYCDCLESAGCDMSGYDCDGDTEE